MTQFIRNRTSILGLAIASALAAQAQANPAISRLTPPSQLFATNGVETTPMIARFIPAQRFDLQATVQPSAGTVTSVEFKVDGVSVGTVVSGPPVGNTAMVTTGLVAGLLPNSAVASLRAYSNATPGVHTLSAIATQSDGSTTTARGNFEVVAINHGGRKAKNVIIMLGDGMGAGHRTAARIMLKGEAQGKAKGKLAMDTFPYTAMIMTGSLNSIVTDSAPGMANYVNGNKAANNQEGVWPDDTKAAFDNPRVEYMSEYLARTQGKKLGIVTTADVFDATPAANAVHTQARGNGTGIVDQYFDDRNLTGLTVLLGGGRKWFLPNPTTCTGSTPSCGTAGSANFNGSERNAATDYALTSDITTGWGANGGVANDTGRDLITEFTTAGWSYAPDATALTAAPLNKPLLGLFSLSNMNVALDKVGKRRGTSTVVDDYGFSNQPLLEEMTDKALNVLDANSPNGFVLMVEGASIDKQAHNMDTERFIVDTIEFDRAIGKAKQYALTHPDTLVIVTADHECAGVAVIGASRVNNASLVTRSASGLGTAAGGPRNGVVGTYELARFPSYTIAGDGYPQSTDPDFKMLIGYGANADRREDWLTNPKPLRDGQQPGNAVVPLNTYPNLPINRDVAGGFMVTGQIEDAVAAHTANDIPLSAMGRGASLLNGTLDNTDVFFKMMQAAVGGTRTAGENEEHDNHDNHE
ncbi:MAG: alkaline phosphatase [Gammaproteobacteria bacterium]|nr:alkaline phosphatase [Gammaproteobacteria bacterium]